MSSVSQQQPLVVYPNTVTTQNKPPATSHSNGSFGTVFIVLAVIVAISAIACFLGRLCNSRFHNHRPKPTHKKPNPQTHNFPDPGYPREGGGGGDPESHNSRPRPREEDVEYAVKGPVDPGGVDFGPRVASGRIIRGFDDHPSQNREVHKFGGGDPRASAYDPHRRTQAHV